MLSIIPTDTYHHRFSQDTLEIVRQGTEARLQLTKRQIGVNRQDDGFAGLFGCLGVRRHPRNTTQQADDQIWKKSQHDILVDYYAISMM